MSRQLGMQHNRFYRRSGDRMEKSMGFHEFALLEYALGERVAQLTEAALEMTLDARMDLAPLLPFPFLPIPAREGGVVP